MCKPGRSLTPSWRKTTDAPDTGAPTDSRNAPAGTGTPAPNASIANALRSDGPMEGEGLSATWMGCQRDDMSRESLSVWVGGVME
jgi:hypothetical protein